MTATHKPLTVRIDNTEETKYQVSLYRQTHGYARFHTTQVTTTADGNNKNIACYDNQFHHHLIHSRLPILHRENNGNRKKIPRRIIKY